MISILIVFVVLYLQWTRTNESANAAAASASWPNRNALFRGQEGFRREKGLVLSARNYEQQQYSQTHASGTSSDTTTLQAQFAIPPLRQYMPRRDEDEDDNDNNNNDNEEDERYHNPSLYGWTPDIYPDPLENPIRCAIAYLPESNQTENGLRYVHKKTLAYIQTL